MKAATDIISDNITPGIISTALPTNDIMNYSQPKVSIILPCYNEEETIGKVIDSINQLMLPNYEIIVVDDGSKDKSVEIIQTRKNTKLFIHKKNAGYGKTLVDGIFNASGDYIITIDSDGQHDPKDIPVLLDIIRTENADIVVGSRYAGKYNYPIPFINRSGEAFIEAVFLLLYGKTVKNNQGGLRVFKKHTLNIFKNLQFKGMAFTTEILMNGFNNGYKIVEGPINLRFRPVGSSRVRRVQLLFDVFKCVFLYTWYRIRDFNKKK